MRFKVDEDLPLEVSHHLRAAVHDASTVHDENMLGTSDEAVWETSQSERRCIVTADKGFGDVRLHAPGTHRGVVLLRLPCESRAGYLALIDRLLAEASLNKATGAITVAGLEGIRIHKGD